jgi:DNA-binding response OmpR family regulator
MAKILIAEDDENLATVVKDWLESERHLVERAADGRTAYELLRLTSYDLIILDWNLPEMTGPEICKSLRSAGKTTPVLMLTGQSAIEDKEHAFNVGADDYLTKPFHIKEVSARVRALLRRTEDPTTQVLKCGNIVLDKASGRVTRDGEPVALLPKEFALLQFFITHPHQVFSLEALQSRIWAAETDISPETVRAHLAKLRGKIEQRGERPLIKTVHRQGYMLEIPNQRSET